MSQDVCPLRYMGGEVSWNGLGRSLTVSPDTISGHFPDSWQTGSWPISLAVCDVDLILDTTLVDLHTAQTADWERDWEDPWCTLFALRAVTMPA